MSLPANVKDKLIGAASKSKAFGTILKALPLVKAVGLDSVFVAFNESVKDPKTRQDLAFYNLEVELKRLNFGGKNWYAILIRETEGDKNAFAKTCNPQPKPDNRAASTAGLPSVSVQ